MYMCTLRQLVPALLSGSLKQLCSSARSTSRKWNCDALLTDMCKCRNVNRDMQCNALRGTATHHAVMQAAEALKQGWQAGVLLQDTLAGVALHCG